KWTSGNLTIDNVIQASQLEASDAAGLIEWIDYSNLESIVCAVDDEFRSVYEAVWKDGPISENKPAWDLEKSGWRRKGYVSVKIFSSSSLVIIIECLN